MNSAFPYRHGGLKNDAVRWDFSVNLNPLGPPEGVLRVIREAADRVGEYPDPRMTELRQRIAGRLPGMFSADRILVGNGASELIVALLRTASPKNVLLQLPNFYGYERTLSVVGMTGSIVPLSGSEEDLFQLPQDAPERIIEIRPDLVCLCNPANPTGHTIAPTMLSSIANACQKTGSLLLVDECFLEFLPDEPQRTLLTKIGKNPYIAVLRAFTKFYAIPGIRLGYAVLGDAWQARSPEMQLPEWNVSVLAEAAGVAALQERSYEEKTRQVLPLWREELKAGLLAIGKEFFPALEVLGGEANYLFLRSRTELFAPLLARGILIRRLDNYRGIPQTGYYRIAVGDPEKNGVLLSAIRSVFSERECF